MGSPPATLTESPKFSAGPATLAIEFENVSLAFEDKQVLDGMSFQLLQG